MDKDLIIVILIWVLCGIIAGLKQNSCISGKTDEESRKGQVAVACITGPIWLLIAAIRQTFIEKWQ